MITRTGITRPWKLTPWIALGLAVALVVAGLALAAYNEHRARTQKLREVAVQAEILAGSVAAALAFDDRAVAQEYVDALRVNRQIEAAGVYDLRGRLVAGYARDGSRLPATSQPAPPRIEGSSLAVAAPVAQGETRLGSVYLRSITEPLGQRAARYAGIGFLVVMAALVVGVLGMSNASLSRAHRTLQAEVAEREKIEQALRQSQKMEAMGQLTGGVAHDFNNLLMIASGGLDLMERATDPAKLDRLRQGVRQAIERGASLTQQLLAFSRRSPLDPQVIDLGARLKDMSTLLDRSLREDITVHLRPAADLWPVEIDPAQLEVALLNIALNARDAMPNGGDITIVADNVRTPSGGLPPGDYVRLAVTDTGVGMADDLAPRAFEPFFTTKGVGKGTGLGLSQVYGFAKASSGDVHLESTLGKGTTVTFLFPRTLKAPPHVQAVAETPFQKAEQARILLVEDDDSVAELVGGMLGELGYEARRAPNAKLALDVLGEDVAFDLVLSDMIMPGEMNGLDLAHEIGRRLPNLPVVLTTGFSDAADAAAREGLRLLRKPYRLETLAAELAAVLAGPQSPARAAP